MMSWEEIFDHLECRTYMPGWEFIVYEGTHEGPHLAIQALLPDAHNPGDTVTVRVENSLPPMPDAAYLDRWMVWRLTRIASHEVREFYRDQHGRAIFDPHAEFAERDA